MPRRLTFPHANINIRSLDSDPVSLSTPMPVHVPIFFIFAEKGPVNTPIWGDTALHQAIFGERTFVERSPYYLHPNIFASYAMRAQSVYLVRLLPEDAATASLVLEAQVKTVDMIQYQKDGTGVRLEDEDGAYIPQLMPDGTTPVTEPGVSVTWRVRPLAADESFDTLQHTTAIVGGVQITTYPIIASVGETPSDAVNRTGYQLYYAPDFDAIQVANVNAMTYRFIPVKRDVNTGTVTSVRNRFDAASVDVTLATESLDTNSDKYIDLVETVATDYVTVDDSGTRSLLPYRIKVYSEYVEAIGQAVLDVSPELDVGPFVVNILSGIDQMRNPYDHLVVGGDGVVIPASGMTSTTTLYHIGGSDGELTKERLEALTAAFVTGDVNPVIKDTFRYPFTHIYDSGYALPIKKKLLAIWAIRDDVKIDFCTQDVALPPNTQAEDLSIGASLRAQILLHPESTVEGTPALRAAIFQQCAKLNTAASFRPYVPLLLDRLVKRVRYDGSTYIKGSPKTRPHSEITMFDHRSINWTPTGDDAKQLSWDTGLNYAQYCNTELMFYPDLRSVYPIDSSVLSDDVLADYLVYVKRIIREQWTYKVGSNEDLKLIQDAIAKDLDNAIYAVFGPRLSTSTVVSQTLLDQQLGYSQTVTCSVFYTPSNRVWNVKVPVGRKV